MVGYFILLIFVEVLINNINNMEDFVKELIDGKQKDLESIVELVINTVKAKALYKRGGWGLVHKELGNKYMNPNFGMHVGTIQNLLKELKIKTKTRIQPELGTIEGMVNYKLGVTAVEYVVDRRAHSLRIVI